MKNIKILLLSLILSSCGNKSELSGNWTLVKQQVQLYDGNKFVKMLPEISGITPHHKLEFKENNKVDFLMEKSESYKDGKIEFEYTLKGEDVYFKAINGDFEDMHYFNYKINNDSLYMYLEIIDAPEDDNLANPNFRSQNIYIRN